MFIFYANCVKHKYPQKENGRGNRCHGEPEISNPCVLWPLLYKSTFTWKNVVEWRHFCQEGWFGGFGLSECAELFSKLDLSSCVQSPQRSFVGLEANKCWTTALSTETQDGRFQNWLESEPEFVTANLKTSVLTLAEYSYCILSKFNIITTYSI